MANAEPDMVRELAGAERATMAAQRVKEINEL
jgi:hypothetical protein